MNNRSKYKEIISAKNGSLIPMLYNGKTIDSRYNPERDADNIISNIEQNYSFFIVLGIASGILISKLISKFNNCKIIAVESTQYDLDFLQQIPLIKSFNKNENIILTDIENLEENLINNYIPALYGDLKIIEQRPWIQESSDLIPIINEKLSHGLGIISADFSVQSHFGKIWQSNIMTNLKKLSNYSNDFTFTIDNNKTAIIVAAGPSLDKTINIIKDNIDNYFIIATDTAYSILIKNKIIPDIVISIDGQFISQNHFNKVIKEKTLFILDLCSNHSVGYRLIKKGCKLLYFTSGHPLSTMANNFSNNNFINLFSGAGTVTITALDLALKLGFNSIKIFGADFGYIDGKSYGKGSYFDKLFGITQDKLSTIEQQFDNLMYRTELKSINKNYNTTAILNAYKLSMESYLIQHNCDYEITNNIYNICNKRNLKLIELKQLSFNYKDFLIKIKQSSIEELTIPLLPYIAWLRNNESFKNNDFNSLLKLAQSHIVSYN